MTKKMRFKVGQKVTVTNGDIVVPTGSVGVVTNDSGEGTFYPYTVKADDISQVSHFDAEDLKAFRKERKAPNGPQVYKGNGAHEWELVTLHNMLGRTYRLRVPGGWLYRYVDLSNGTTPITRAMELVPAPEAIGYKV